MIGRSVGRRIVIVSLTSSGKLSHSLSYLSLSPHRARYAGVIPGQFMLILGVAGPDLPRKSRGRLSDYSCAFIIITAGRVVATRHHCEFGIQTRPVLPFLHYIRFVYGFCLGGHSHLAGNPSAAGFLKAQRAMELSITFPEKTVSSATPAFMVVRRVSGKVCLPHSAPSCRSFAILDFVAVVGGFAAGWASCFAISV